MSALLESGNVASQVQLAFQLLSCSDTGEGNGGVCSPLGVLQTLTCLQPFFENPSRVAEQFGLNRHSFQVLSSGQPPLKLEMNGVLSDQALSQLLDYERRGLLKLAQGGPLNRLALKVETTFKGNWNQEFPVASTHAESFRGLNGRSSQVAMMHGIFTDIPFGRFSATKEGAPAFDALMLSFQSGAQLLILHPERGCSEESFLRFEEACQRPDFWEKLLPSMRCKKLDLMLPKSSLSSSMRGIESLLESWGISKELPGLAKSKDGIWEIISINQKAEGEIDEKGARFSAQTSTDCAFRSGYEDPTQVRINSPYLAMVLSPKEGKQVVEFFQKVVDPSQLQPASNSRPYVRPVDNNASDLFI